MSAKRCHDQVIQNRGLRGHDFQRITRANPSRPIGSFPGQIEGVVERTGIPSTRRNTEPRGTANPISYLHPWDKVLAVQQDPPFGLKDCVRDGNMPELQAESSPRLACLHG